MTDDATLERIANLVIPPAWTDVWICPDPHGHIQATGTDAAGRRQYRYHDRWSERRSAAKFQRLEAFAHGLPDLRAQVSHDLAGRTLSRERVLACTVRLLDATTFRIGSDTYARENGSFGLTTIRRDHVTVGRTRAVFHYRGKGGLERTHDVRDPDALRVIRALHRREDRGRRLFVYGNGRLAPIHAADVNQYIRDGVGVESSAKDFRTWHATVLAAVGLAGIESDHQRSSRAVDRDIAGVVRAVATVLGNTPAVCRSSYIDPRVIDRFRDGSTIADDLATLPDDDVAPGRWGEAARQTVESAVLALLAGDRVGRRAA